MPDGKPACQKSLYPPGFSPERANAHYTSVLQGTNLIGAALAGFLIVEFGIASILWLDVGTFIIALGLLLSLGPGKVLDQSQQADSEGGQGRGALSRFMQDIFAGIRFLWHKPVLRTFVFIDTMRNCSGGPFAGRLAAWR